VDIFEKKHTDFIHSADFSGDSKYFMTSSEDKTIGIFKKSDSNGRYIWIKSF
jgi:WD40 repeat protein